MKATFAPCASCLVAVLVIIPVINADTTASSAASTANKRLNSALRDELLSMTVEDQAVRVKHVDQFTDEDRKRMSEVDTKHEERMKAIVTQHGWPGRSLVGDEAAEDAWLIVQHCQVDFQEHCLPLLKQAVDANDASGKCYAYLLDRVRMYRGRPQIYGTQFMNDKLVPIEDPEHVDERRKAVGLGSLSEYVAFVCKMNGWPNQLPEPTASSVTPPAGAGGAPSGAAVH
jgi:hypothetical protein